VLGLNDGAITLPGNGIDVGRLLYVEVVAPNNGEMCEAAAIVVYVVGYGAAAGCENGAGVVVEYLAGGNGAGVGAGSEVGVGAGTGIEVEIGVGTGMEVEIGVGTGMEVEEGVRTGIEVEVGVGTGMEVEVEVDTAGPFTDTVGMVVYAVSLMKYGIAFVVEVIGLFLSSSFERGFEDDLSSMSVAAARCCRMMAPLSLCNSTSSRSCLFLLSASIFRCNSWRSRSCASSSALRRSSSSACNSMSWASLSFNSAICILVWVEEMLERREEILDVEDVEDLVFVLAR